jgi:hypothetical protein
VLKKEYDARVRESLNLEMESIQSKANAHDYSVDRFATTTTRLYLERQDKVLNDSEVAAMTLDIVRMCHQLNESALLSEAL